MYIQIKKRKIDIYELKSFWERFKSLKFVLEPIDYGIKFTKKKYISTTFYCQKVDIVWTDKDDKIIRIEENVKTEKRMIKFKAYNIYVLPLGSIKYLDLGDKMPIRKEKK